MMERKKQLLMVISAIVIIATLAGGFWYKEVYTKTPEYTFKMIQQSLKDNDLETFKKYVDIDSLATQYTDDFLDVSVQNTDSKGDPNWSKQLALEINKQKPALAKDIATLIANKVQDSKSNKAENSDKYLKKFDIISIYLDGIWDIESPTIKSIKKDGKSAVVSVEAMCYSLRGDYVFEIAMSQTEDGSWKVTRITNFKEYLNRTIKQAKIDIREYIKATDPVKNESNQKLRAKNKGKFTAEDAQAIIDLYKERQTKMDAIPVPRGAKIIADLRKQSTEKQIKYFTWLRDQYKNGKGEFPNPPEIRDLKNDRRDIEKRLGDILTNVKEY